MNDLQYLASRLKYFNAYIYGGVVRDFIVGKNDAKDIDIWFPNKEAMKRFLNSQTFMNCTPYNKPDEKDNYDFQRYQYHVQFKQSNHRYIMDFIVSSEFPVNDFNVNQLILFGKVARHVSCLTSKTNEEHKAAVKLTNIICTQIKNKEMTMLDTYLEYVIKSTPAGARIDKFKYRGWNIHGLPENLKQLQDNYRMTPIKDRLFKGNPVE